MTEVRKAPRTPPAPPAPSGTARRMPTAPSPLRGNSSRARLMPLLGLGAFLAAAVIIGALLLPGAGSPATGRTAALTRSQAAYATLQRGIGRLAIADRACHAFTCQIAIDEQTARDYRAFADMSKAILMPAGSPAVAARQLEQAATQTALAGDTLAGARTVTQLRSLEAISPSMADIVQAQQDDGYLRYLLARR